jgi:hypothetical protein
MYPNHDGEKRRGKNPEEIDGHGVRGEETMWVTHQQGQVVDRNSYSRSLRTAAL